MKPPQRTPKEERARVQLYKRHWRLRYPEKSLWREAKKRAVMRGKKFTIKIEDVVIPERCPVLGIKLVCGGQIHNNCATLDEIRPGKGYTPKNICVISWRANRLKSDASLAEVKKILRYYEERTKCR